MKYCDQPYPSLETSNFNQGLIQIREHAGQYCNLQASSSAHPNQSWWENFFDLFISGLNNFGENYSDLLFSGEIGAVFMVALVPLFLGLFIEAALIINHRRRDQLSNSDRRIELLQNNKGLLFQTLEMNKQDKRKRYIGGYLFVFLVQLILLLFFLIVGPQYDRDVWCNENRTQFAILTSGLETERLQADQKQANCEIRQAVSTLQNLFSKENKNTVNNIKKVSGQLDNSVKKLDKANASIDDFKVKIEEATENTEDVLETLSIMQSIASQLGVEKEGEATQSLPDQLTNIELILHSQPDQTWMVNQLLSKQDFNQSRKANTQRQNSQQQALKKLSQQQEELSQKIEALSKKALSADEIDAISERLANKIEKRHLFNLFPPSSEQGVMTREK